MNSLTMHYIHPFRSAAVRPPLLSGVGNTINIIHHSNTQHSNMSRTKQTARTTGQTARKRGTRAAHDHNASSSKRCKAKIASDVATFDEAAAVISAARPTHGKLK